MFDLFFKEDKGTSPLGFRNFGGTLEVPPWKEGQWHLRKVCLISPEGPGASNGLASEDPVAKAERQYEMIEENRGDNYEIFDAARKVEEAALEAEESKIYEH